jgi:hypothetical protein
VAKKMPRRAVADLAKSVNQEAQQQGSSGWTVRAYGADAGAKAADAYAVSLPKAQVEEQIKTPLATRSLTRYQRRNKNLLSQGLWHGGWIPKEGSGTQDVSQLFPRTDEGFKEAYKAGARNMQEQIGELGPSGEYVGGVDIPAELRSGNTWSEGVKGDPMKPAVSKQGKTVKITPSKAEMAEVYAAEELEKRKRK